MCVWDVWNIEFECATKVVGNAESGGMRKGARIELHLELKLNRLQCRKQSCALDFYDIFSL